MTSSLTSTLTSSTLSSSLSSSLSSLSSLEQDLVALMKSSIPARFSALVTMHLSFMLDLSGTGLSELLDADRQRPSVTSELLQTKFISSILFSAKKHAKDHHKSAVVFGHPLTSQSIKRIYPVIEFLALPDNLKQEGLFRKAGHVDRQRLLYDRLNSAEEEKPDLHDFTVHDCANVLKTFLGELPEPLLTEKYLTAYRQVVEMQSDARRLQTLQLLIQLLPTEHATLLRHLLDLLHRVTLEPGNRMTADNLAILFVPHIIVPRKTPMNELQQTSANFTGLVSFMITSSDELFQWPEALVRDIELHYRTVQESVGSTLVSTDDDEILCPSSSSTTNRKEVSDEDGLVTSVEFADRQASQLAAVKFDTATAIAELFTHVSQMPDSTCKRRLMKQFNKSMGTPSSNTPSKRKIAVSFTQSIKKMLNKRHRSGAAIDGSASSTFTNTIDTAVEVGTPARANLDTSSATSSETPVKKLFTDDSSALDLVIAQANPLSSKDVSPAPNDESNPRASRDDVKVSDVAVNLTSSSDAAPLVVPSLPAHGSTPSSKYRVSGDVRGRRELYDIDSGDSDKENTSSDAVFVFHHTPSVVAMERIFAQQRLPSYVKPNGYISPLRCPRYLMTSSLTSSVTVSATP